MCFLFSCARRLLKSGTFKIHIAAHGLTGRRKLQSRPSQLESPLSIKLDTQMPVLASVGGSFGGFQDGSSGSEVNIFGRHPTLPERYLWLGRGGSVCMCGQTPDGQISAESTPIETGSGFILSYYNSIFLFRDQRFCKIGTIVCIAQHSTI